MFLFPLNRRAKGAALRQPKEIACWSRDDNGDFHYDARSLSYFYFPDANLDKASWRQVDLSAGFSKFRNIDLDAAKRSEHLDSLLRALMLYEKENGATKVKVDMITYRGIMTSLLTLPYNDMDDIDLNLVHFDGQIFIEEDVALKQAKKRVQDDRDSLMTYHGYRFEHAMTLSKPWAHCSRDQIEARYSSDQAISNYAEFGSLVRSGAGSVKVLLAGEVDCVRDYRPTDIKTEDPLPHYMELKLNRLIQDDKGMRNFERKLFKHWAQSFLLGVPTIVYGFRSDDGIVRAIEQYQTADLPKIIRDSNRHNPKYKWNANEAIAFYCALLEWIRTTITENNVEGAVWRLEFKAKSQQLQLRIGDAQDFMLPEFVAWRKSIID